MMVNDTGAGLRTRARTGAAFLPHSENSLNGWVVQQSTGCIAMRINMRTWEFTWVGALQPCGTGWALWWWWWFITCDPSTWLRELTEWVSSLSRSSTQRTHWVGASNHGNQDRDKEKKGKITLYWNRKGWFLTFLSIVDENFKFPTIWSWSKNQPHLIKVSNLKIMFVSKMSNLTKK